MEETTECKTGTPGLMLNEDERADKNSASSITTFRSCRNAGKKGDFDRGEFCQSIARREAKVMSQQEQNQLASVLGYKGFALVQKGLYSQALDCLEQSKFRRHPSSSTDDHEQRRMEGRAVDACLKTCYRRLGKAPPLPPLIKYPRTMHLFDSGGTATSIDDLVLPDLMSVVPIFCDGKSSVAIEEKVDGANLGISVCPYTNQIMVQNRSHYIARGEHPQFSMVPAWIEEHRDALMRVLGEGNLILYGEWLAARHSIPYQKLPGYFVAFDIFCKGSGRFFSRETFHSTMQRTQIPVVPTISTRTFGPSKSATRAADGFRQELLALLETAESRFRSDGGAVEGMVLRIDEDRRHSRGGGTSPSWLKHKYKIVRPDFLRGCGGGHWASRPIEKQRVDRDFGTTYLESCCPFSRTQP